jgi:hypothetical protein
MKGTAIFLISAAIIGLIIFGMYVNITNKEITLRNRTEAQQETCKANYDKMFKVISQTAQVPTEFMSQAKDAFQSIYTPLMEGRYSNDRGGALMSWVSEHNPTFDLGAAADMYKQLQIVIEANRQEYFIEQKKLIDMQREHRTYIAQFPQRIFLGAMEAVEITIITSEKTEQIYESGREDDINLF